MMISIVITSFNEPNVKKAIDAILNQKINEKYELIVSAPDAQTEKLVNSYARKYRQLTFFKDKGQGKSAALNQVFKVAKGSILILTDGDVFAGRNSVNEILKCFKDKKVGCVSGRPAPLNPRNTMLGYWYHLLATAGAHKIRKKLSKKDKFLECSAYLIAFRNLIKEIPVDVAEDAIIPFYIWKKGYKIKYAENALIYVQNPTNLKDFIKQRKRTADAHTKLTNYIPDFPKVKCFKNEVKGIFDALSYPKTYKEFYWTLLLVVVRLYIWLSLFFDLKFRKKEYLDGWEKVKTTK